MLRYHLTRVSSNSKTGPIPTVMISRGSCPPSCPLYSGGCYARGGNVRLHWDRVDDRGMRFDDLLGHIRNFPHNQIWRYAVAGDLPGTGEKVSPFLLQRLVSANAGRRGFTYTHKNPLNPTIATAIAAANRRGFTINLSSNNVAQADDYLRLRIGPVVTLIPEDFGEDALTISKLTGKEKAVRRWRNVQTPEGVPVVQCPAEYNDSVQCANCGGSAGPMCQRADRSFVVGFTVHGVSKRKASDVAKGLRVLP